MKSRRRETEKRYNNTEGKGGKSLGPPSCGEKKRAEMLVSVLSEVSRPGFFLPHSSRHSLLRLSLSLSVAEAFTAVAQGGRPAGRGQRAEEEEARFDKQAVAEGRRQFSSTVHPGAATSIYLYSCLLRRFVPVRRPPVVWAHCREARWY